MSKDKEYTLQYIGRLEGHSEAVTSLVCGKDEEGKPLLISGSRDKSIIVWDLNLEEQANADEKPEDLKCGKPKKSLHGHNHFVSSLALNRDGKKLISGSWDKTARLWDIPSSRCQQIFSGHRKDILTVGFSHDERMIFTGAMDNTLKYWNTKGENKFDNTQFQGWVSSILNIKKGKDHYMAVGSWDSNVRLLNEEYIIEKEIPGDDYAVTSISVDDDGEFLFIAYKNGKVSVWNITDDKLNLQPKRDIETGVDINAIKFENKFFEIFAIGTSKGLQIRKIKDKDNKGPLFEYPKSEKNSILNGCNAICYDPSKTYLFAAFNDSTIRVFKFDFSEARE